MAPSNTEQLAIVLRQKQQALDRNVAAEESQNIKRSLLFQFNWPELLQSAPTAISSMGACFVAASSPHGAGVKFDSNIKFKHLIYPTLSANLTETANLGRYAFNEAQSGMDRISSSSDIIQGKLRDVLMLLNDPASARVMLKPQLGAVAQSAQSCASAAQSIEAKFNDWLNYACEMHSACIHQEQTSADIIRQNEITIAAEQTKLDLTKDAVESAKTATDLFSNEVKVASEAFKKASDEFPQRIVGDFAGSLNTALKGVTQAVISKVANAEGSSKGGLPPKTDLNGSEKKQQSSNTTLTPGAATDPAAAAIQRNMNLLELLNSYINGPDGGIDWQKASADGSDNKKAIAYVVKVLDFAKSSFLENKKDTEMSNKMAKVLEVTSDVANSMLKTIDESKKITSSWPAANSPEVQKLVTDFRAQYAVACQLYGAASAAQGTGASVGVMANAEPASGSDLKAGQTHAEVVLESAKNRLSTTTQAYKSSQTNYLESSKLLVEQQKKLADVSSSLKKLTESNITLTETKAILVQSIKLIVQLKSQINNLVQFFMAINVIINVVVRTHVEPFVEVVKAISSGGQAFGSNWIIGNYTYTDLMRTNVFTSVLTLRTYFSVFGDIARMWNKLSIEHIQPGLHVLDQLSIPDQSGTEIPKKMTRLAEWSDGARSKVQELAATTQNELTNGIDQRVNSITADMQMLPAPQGLDAITEGTQSTVEEVKVSLEVKQKSSPFSIPAGDDW